MCDTDNCSGGAHKLVNNILAGDYINLEHDCLTGLCNVHTSCHESFAFGTTSAFREAAAYIRSASPRDLDHFIESNARQMSLNESRQAIQINACGGSIVAMVPITAEQMTGLLVDRRQ